MTAIAQKLRRSQPEIKVQRMTSNFKDVSDLTWYVLNADSVL